MTTSTTPHPGESAGPTEKRADSCDEVRFLLWNIEHNGVDADGCDKRWHRAMDVAESVGAHVVLRQEVTRGHAKGQRAKWAEATRLGGFFPFLASATEESANPTAVYVDPTMFEPVQEFEHRTALWHPICNPVVRLKGCPKTLSLASFHLCSWDPDKRVREARRLTILGRPGMEAILGGDCNSYPHAADEAPDLPDWGRVNNRTHFEQRTVVNHYGVRVSDTRPDKILAGRHDQRASVFMELGQYAVKRLGQSRESALAPTASLWKSDQGPMQRIDRFYATAGIAKALRRVEVLDHKDVKKSTDHAAVVAVFSEAEMRRVLSPEPADTA
ncbi:endonuclease/exonuclease/phosphatase family protein [Streptomyces spectabilis]|uniref:endonuclease/exonuclease/phosphatase family protein n=1 Tax=Streptomyces spectabilis TaxID=68270 RepID=UPI0033DFE030